jgi:putative serine protease PepD
MSTDDRQPHWNPPSGGPNEGPGPYYLPDGRLGGYAGTDFPAPAGVRPVAEHAASPPPPRANATKPRGRAGAIIAAASLSAVIGAGAGIGSYAYLVDGSARSASPITVTSAPASQSPALNGTIAAAAAKIDASLVTITVRTGQSGDIGSGVVLDKDGHILTNDHVVQAAEQQQGTITVTFGDGTVAKATIVGTSETNDLAVIKVDGVANLNPATFAKSDSLVVGQTVVAAGAPLGLSESVTSGIVSNTARPVRSGSNNDAVYLAVQTDAAINPGNSGGPLVDLNGSVVGINSSIASTDSSQDSQSGNIGIGFAIPSDVAVRVASELIKSGHSTNAALGVTVAGDDSALPTTTGVALQTVKSGGPADQAGLQAGDVVTKINNFHTTTSDGLIAATRFYAPGTAVQLTYTRGGAPSTVTVTLGTA